MRKAVLIFLAVLLVGLFAACYQDVTVDTDVYYEMEMGTFTLNGKSYATLQDAVNALNAGKAVGDNVIYLNKNAKGPGAVINNNNVVIDFGGHTFDFTNVSGLQGILGGDFGLTISQGSDVTLRGLEQVTLDDSFSTDLTMIFIEGNDTTLRIEKAPKLVVADDQYVFWAANGASLIIGEQESESSVNIAGAVAATGGESEESKPTIIIQGNSKAQSIEVSNSTVFVSDSSVVSGNLTAKDSSNVVISTDDGVTQKIAKMDKDAGSSVTVASGAIKVDSLAEESDGEIVTVGTGSVSPESASGVTVEEDHDTVAMIGAEKYTNATLAGAIDNLEDNTRTVVKIVNNANTIVSIPGNKNVALDLSKYTLTGNISVGDGGVLEITGRVDDSTCSGKVAGSLSTSGTGKLSVISGTFSSNPSEFVVAYSSVEGTADPFRVTVNTDGVASLTRDGKQYYFKTPDKAFEYVEDNETIEILQNCSLSSSVTLQANNVVLDLDEHSINGGESYSFTISGDSISVINGSISLGGPFTIDENSDSVSFNNCTITSGSLSVNGDNVSVEESTVSVADTFTITGDNTSLKNNNITVVNPLTISGDSVSVTNSTITNSSSTTAGAYAVTANNAENLVLEDVTLTGGLSATGGSTVTVKGSDTTITGKDGYTALNADGSETVLTLEEGTYSHTGTGVVFNESYSGNIVVTGGTYTMDPSDYYSGEYAIEYKDGKWIVEDPSAPKTIDDNTEYLKAGFIYNVEDSKQITIDDTRLSIDGTGEVVLNLKDDSVLNIPKGFEVAEGQTLVIRGSGTINILGPIDGVPGIGGAGNIRIEGGIVNVSGVAEGAGISGDTVTITGGNINAQGGQHFAGINGSASVTITGGEIDAQGGEGAFGIAGPISSASALKVSTDNETWRNYTQSPADNRSRFMKTGAVVDSVTFDKSSIIIYGIGSTETIVATVSAPEGADKTLEWESSDPNIATVDDDGVVTSVAESTSAITITARTTDGSNLTATCSVTVSPGIPVQTVLTATNHTLNTGVYIVNSNFTHDYRITVSGDVTLILGANKTFTAPGGFYVAKGNSLTINGTGSLLVNDVPQWCAAIGGVEKPGTQNPEGIRDAGTITINGGIITVTGGVHSAGIGGGYSGNGGVITINGGTVNATGGNGAAGIGSGGYGSHYNGGTITIGGGSVTATGGSNGAGIGGGYGANSGIIKISGGTVEAHGESGAAGIGGGIASGAGVYFDGGKCDITISGGSVTAVGGSNAAGIGNGSGRNTGTITITGGTVNATGGNEGPGIGGGFIQHQTVEETLTIEISGGDVTAIGGIRGAGIGTAYFNGGKASVGTVTITGGTVVATGGDKLYEGDFGGAGIGTGYSNDSTFGEGVVLTISGSNTQVTATGKDGAAGIGGAVNQNGGTITINGGTVTATGAEGASGIGAGHEGASQGSLTTGTGVTIQYKENENWVNYPGTTYSTRYRIMGAGH